MREKPSAPKAVFRHTGRITGGWGGALLVAMGGGRALLVAMGRLSRCATLWERMDGLLVPLTHPLHARAHALLLLLPQAFISSMTASC